MIDYWLLAAFGVICIIIAYFFGIQVGHDKAINDMIKHFEEETARDLQRIKEGHKEDDSKR